ncbi:probable CCR4-associated factor 1 homolog 11 [Mercurialis annua]|uniref:probable CCR4-associated factor 1 homolog 11 n=1 Tax=Mercurialis annua TaxID=3986 RepID=UPI00215DE21B|nr:probable CCR4-associated factor 1 homolog 11 [Mercurialis annua]
MSRHRQSPLPPRPPPRMEVRSVWAENLETEFNLIRSVIDKYPLIAMDTEFPGVVVRSAADDLTHRDPKLHYSNLKSNVDMLNLIQLGLTMADFDGNLPDLGSTKKCYYIWEFNFCDFDVSRDPHAHDSVEMLRSQGIDFERNRKFGVDSVKFAELMMSSGLVLNDSVSWVSFHGAYDFGYLIKCLTQSVLPGELTEFVELVRVFFGSKAVYDVKHLIKFCDLFGGLDRVGMALGVNRAVGKKHQAGSDSLLTLHVFQKLKEKHFEGKDDGKLDKYGNILYGLEILHE